jgi:hypothetical protein
MVYYRFTIKCSPGEFICISPLQNELHLGSGVSLFLHIAACWAQVSDELLVFKLWLSFFSFLLKYALISAAWLLVHTSCGLYMMTSWLLIGCGEFDSKLSLFFSLPAKILPVCYLFILIIMYLQFKLNLVFVMQFCLEHWFMWEAD